MHIYKTNKDLDELIGDDIQYIIDISQHTHIPYDRLIQYLNKQIQLRGGLTNNED